MHYVMAGLSFTILSETPCADPHARCCGRAEGYRPSATQSCVIYSWLKGVGTPPNLNSIALAWLNEHD
jgi:hypothetical protein